MILELYGVKSIINFCNILMSFQNKPIRLELHTVHLYSGPTRMSQIIFDWL